MQLIRTADNVGRNARLVVGGKANRLAQLQRHGFSTAPWICITSDAYQAYLDHGGLRERIALELYRKAFENMRWEELWDCATRIRHMFLTNALPKQIETELTAAIGAFIQDAPVVVRSSAIDEDHAQASFAGLHESFVNVNGVRAVLDCVRLVWASLWSDAALLYRKEIGLDIEASAMAVLVQKMVVGSSSGVVFSQHPDQPSRAVIESVHGLNQGLVDGTIAPDRWIVDRAAPRIISWSEVTRTHHMVPGPKDVALAALPDTLAAQPPLTERQVLAVRELALKLESLFGAPQDVEWTFSQSGLIILQSRDITTGQTHENDQRGWYLSLHKSFDQLRALRKRIEATHIPEMVAAAAEMTGADLGALSPAALAKEIQRRWEISRHWSKIYWDEFIPYAHGVRLFGQFYNDRVRPQDPYEFIDLLTETDMLSLARNQQLQNLASLYKQAPEQADHLSKTLDQSPFENALRQFLEQFGDLSEAVTGSGAKDPKVGPLMRLIGEMARNTPDDRSPSADANGASHRSAARMRAFLDHFTPDERDQAAQILDLARSSYRLRDDDNIHLGRIEAQFMHARDAGRQRLAQLPPSTARDTLQEVIDRLGPVTASPSASRPDSDNTRVAFRQRQLVGQPAGPGLARGRARVIHGPEDLMAFEAGDILVCDAVDPNMTFVVPLAVAVVERRGGMLIHGAIIAREYGLPCITGVPKATALIKTGDRLTVDGYLGIVTLN